MKRYRVKNSKKVKRDLLTLSILTAIIVVGIILAAKEGIFPGAKSPSPVEILNTRHYYDGYNGVLGEVRNNTSEDIEFTVTLNCFDENDKFIGSSSFSWPGIWAGGLPPGQKHPFKLWVHGKQASRHELTVTHRKAALPVINAKLEILRVESGIREETRGWPPENVRFFYVEGEIKNVGPTGSQPLATNVVFYGAEGKVLDYVSASFGDFWALMTPGRITTFKAEGPEHTSSYALLFY